jgi:hypothetical protein
MCACGEPEAARLALPDAVEVLAGKVDQQDARCIAVGAVAGFQLEGEKIGPVVLVVTAHDGGYAPAMISNEIAEELVRAVEASEPFFRIRRAGGCSRFRSPPPLAV